MKAVEQVAEAKKIYIDELDYLRLQKGSDDQKLMDAAIADLRLKQQITQMKMNICDLSKQNLQAQMNELITEEKSKFHVKENLGLYHKTTIEADFKRRFEIPDGAKYTIDQLTRELKVDHPN